MFGYLRIQTVLLLLLTFDSLVKDLGVGGRALLDPQSGKRQSQRIAHFIQFDFV